MKSAVDVMSDLVRPSNITVKSDQALAGGVNLAADEHDERREAEGQDKIRRKPALQPLGGTELQASVHVTLWEILHTLGRAMALSRRGAGRGLAEHWGCLKYSQALTGGVDSFMTLSAEGREIADHYKAIQSGELGIGIGLVLARRFLHRRYPGHCVSIVAADTALRAGWALTSREEGPRSGYRYRPQYFAEVWQPGKAPRAIPIACKGNHSNAAESQKQLASASAHVEAVHIGAWNDTPALVVSTEIPTDGALTLHALQAPGKGGWLRGTVDSHDGLLDRELADRAITPFIQPPAEAGELPPAESGYHVRPDDYPWFRQVLARAEAAALSAFAGDGETTARYLTKRQGRHRFTGFAHAATGSVQDARQTLLGVPFLGTDHVFRLNGTRVEAFSGIAQDLFDHLARGQVEAYREEVYARRSSPQRVDWDPRWLGPVSVQPDGSALALRVMP
jgi:hypothetical protein